jgi:hypothetical protein
VESFKCPHYGWNPTLADFIAREMFRQGISSREGFQLRSNEARGSDHPQLKIVDDDRRSFTAS